MVKLIMLVLLIVGYLEKFELLHHKKIATLNNLYIFIYDNSNFYYSPLKFCLLFAMNFAGIRFLLLSIFLSQIINQLFHDINIDK